MPAETRQDNQTIFVYFPFLCVLVYRCCYFIYNFFIYFSYLKVFCLWSFPVHSCSIWLSELCSFHASYAIAIWCAFFLYISYVCLNLKQKLYARMYQWEREKERLEEIRRSSFDCMRFDLAALLARVRRSIVFPFLSFFLALLIWLLFSYSLNLFWFWKIGQSK